MNIVYKDLGLKPSEYTADLENDTDPGNNFCAHKHDQKCDYFTNEQFNNNSNWSYIKIHSSSD